MFRSLLSLRFRAFCTGDGRNEALQEVILGVGPHAYPKLHSLRPRVSILPWRSLSPVIAFQPALALPTSGAIVPIHTSFGGYGCPWMMNDEPYAELKMVLCGL